MHAQNRGELWGWVPESNGKTDVLNRRDGDGQMGPEGASYSSTGRDARASTESYFRGELEREGAKGQPGCVIAARDDSSRSAGSGMGWLKAGCRITPVGAAAAGRRRQTGRCHKCPCGHMSQATAARAPHQSQDGTPCRRPLERRPPRRGRAGPLARLQPRALLRKL